MEVLMVLIVIVVLVAVFAYIILGMVAYSEGRDDANSTYLEYNNSYRMPLAFVYDKGYADGKRHPRKDMARLNKKRFNREED